MPGCRETFVRVGQLCGVREDQPTEVGASVPVHLGLPVILAEKSQRVPDYDGRLLLGSVVDSSATLVSRFRLSVMVCNRGVPPGHAEQPGFYGMQLSFCGGDRCGRTVASG